MKEVDVPFENAVVATTHVSKYLMHKFWARKPANVIAEYIKYFTNENDLILDPFCGSGVTVIEAAELGRKAIYNDLSPTARFIAENTAKNIDLTKYSKAISNVCKEVEREVSTYYQTLCTKCGHPALITHTIWQRNEITDTEKMLTVKTNCTNCKNKEERTPIEEDIKVYHLIEKKKIPYWYPTDEMIQNGRLLVKHGMRVNDLFNKRALFVLSKIWYEIESLQESDEKEVIKFTFTSALAQASKLVPVYSKKGRENQVGGWTMPGFWTPPKYCEVNALNCFIERSKKIKRGKEIRTKNFEKIVWLNESAFKLNSIKSEAIDYIFTDPPYGDSVPHFEYYVIWASWLKQSLDFENEIVISDSPVRTKNLDNYKQLFKKTFIELYRVLKPDSWMTVTFHNSHIQVWNALISSVLDAGFEYGNDCYVLTGRKSANQLLRKGGSMTGDIYINFKKPKIKRKNISKDIEEVINEIYKESEKIIIERGGYATTDQLARGILMNLSKHNLFEKVLDLRITDILSEKFDYDTELSIWTLRSDKEAKLLEYIPLNTRISCVIDNVLNKNKSGGYEIDEFLVPIFTRYKNGRTPETIDIKKLLEEKAFEKNGRWFPISQESLFDEKIMRKDYIDPEEIIKIENEHNSIIYQLAKVGLKQNYQIWVGENEKRKTKELNKLSIRELQIAGLSDKAIKDSRINQIDLIWLKPDIGVYLLFEIENSTRMINCIPRLANLTEKLPHLKIPIYIVIPDRFYDKAVKSFNDPSNKKLIEKDRFIIRYSNLFDNLDLLENQTLNINNFIQAVSEKI